MRGIRDPYDFGKVVVDDEGAGLFVVVGESALVHLDALVTEVHLFEAVVDAACGGVVDGAGRCL